jgi:hypothetical protein
MGSRPGAVYSVRIGIRSHGLVVSLTKPRRKPSRDHDSDHNTSVRVAVPRIGGVQAMTEMRGTFLSRRKRKKRAKRRCTDPTVAKPCKGGAVRGLAGIRRGQSPAPLDGRGSSMTNHGVRLPLRTKRRRICRVHWQDPTSYFVPDGRWQPSWRPVAGSRQPRLVMMPASLLVPLASLSLCRCSAWRTSQGRGGGPSAAWPAAWPAWDGGSYGWWMDGPTPCVARAVARCVAFAWCWALGGSSCLDDWSEC